MVSKLALAASLSLAMAFMASCVGDDSSAFVGKWIYEDGSKSLELFKDGTGINKYKYITSFSDGEKSVSITWKIIENKRFVIANFAESYSYTYEISGRILTLTDDKGKKEIYVKAQEGKIEGKTLIDNRDSKKYKTVIIGVQTWMAENLNYNAEGSKCYGEGGEVATDYDDKGNITATKTLSDREVLDICTKYGRLYDWNTAKTACPSGWHLPSKNEWDVLEKIVGGLKVAGKKLKSKSDWSNNVNGTDEFGFSALPGGLGKSDGNFVDVGYFGYWWSASEYNNSYAYNRSIDYNRESIGQNPYGKSSLQSIRCVRDSQPTQEPTLVGAIIPLLIVVGVFVAIFLVLKKFLKFFFRKIKSLRTEKKN
jgi:uncharacterized protein (TIGR02145 family)